MDEEKSLKLCQQSQTLTTVEGSGGVECFLLIKLALEEKMKNYFQIFQILSQIPVFSYIPPKASEPNPNPKTGTITAV